MEAEREKRWEAFRAIAARNADEDPEVVERDVAEEIESMRQEERVGSAATRKS